MPRLFAVNFKDIPLVEAAIYLLLALMSCTVSTRLQAQALTTTTVSDTIFRADGTVASGTVLISWPSFVSAAGEAVAAGNLAVYRPTRPQRGCVPGGHLLFSRFSIG